MLYALDKYGEKIPPEKGQRAICPLCKGDVISKCGDIVNWHWAHESVKECDSYHEPESEWHYSWKNMFPKEYQEVVIGNHRADIQKPNGTVIELQNSSLSVKKIKEREDFYNKMIWIFNLEDCYYRFNFTEKISSSGNKYYTYYWEHPKKFTSYTTKPTYFDFGRDKIFLRKQATSPWHGWGYFESKMWITGYL